MPVSAFLAMGSGITLVLIMRGDSLDLFFRTGWGAAILIAFVASMVGIGLGISTVVLGRRMAGLAGSLAGRPPSPQEAARMRAIAGRPEQSGRVPLTIMAVARGAMAAARFV